MKKSSSKISFAVFMVCMVFFSLTACSLTKGSETSISAMIMVAEIPEQYQTIMDDFMKKNPNIKVDLQTMTGNVNEALQPKAASNSLPDLMSINADSFGNALADEGKLADLSSTKAWENMLDSLKPEWTSEKGKHFGISGGFASTLIYYNKSLFEKAGIKSLPQNWEEFLSACESLKKAGITPLILEGAGVGCIGNCWYSYGLALDVVSKSADYKKDIREGTFNFNTPEMAKVFGRIKELADAKFVNEDYMSTDYNGGLQMFTQGKAAMIFNGTWVGGTVTEVKEFETGAFLPPINSAGEKIVPVLSSETGWAVADGKNKDAAIKLLEYLNGEGYSIYQNARGNVPHIKLDKIQGEIKLSGVLKSIVNDISKYDSSVPLSFAYMPSNAAGNTDKIIQEVLLGQKTPEEAAAQINELVKASVK